MKRPWALTPLKAGLMAGILLAVPAALVAQSLGTGAGLPTAGLPQDPELGSVTGKVTALDGTVLQGVRVQLTGPGLVAPRVAMTDASGAYSFAMVPPGSFALVASVEGFKQARIDVTVTPGGVLAAPAVTLAIETAISDVRVVLTEKDIALEEVNEEEKQRVFGVIPNFLVSYDWKPAPLSSRQKFALAWRMVIDPVPLAVTAVVAGVQQANNDYPGYGQGAAGYGKRLGAGYGDLLVGTMLGSAVLPVVFRQDPRFLYKSSGSTTNRALYAMSATVICRSDKGRWEPNYSNILGSLGAGAISNLYYPASNRNGASVTVENGLIGVASGAIGNLFEEFLVRKLTPHPPPTTP
jgi:hypothetical protein